ncbi:glycosyltransferase [Mesorhizobium huakuii]|uniref:Glycosyltransferase family 2 protein n=1 Tax=Mesorhizobium huakuii TaxID=28104 RepID=A0ABZ0VLK2_9HYPH|nr:glycosyltransferase family 2 protein [Mesorhizobium huakuii]WQB97848.1 glycosyltransferase family 2 protein [Mesorhizobium huakuii]
MPISIQQQSVIYRTDIYAIERSLESIARAAELAVPFGVSEFCLVYGDSSPDPCLTDDQISVLRNRFSNITIKYDFFNGNLGSAGGHNRLAAAATADFILIQNPDVVPAPRLLENLIAPFSDKGIGMVEAKQIPIEHPKEYDTQTGDTSWASTACAIVRRDTYERIGGFDAKTFFLYCDDVDFSWRVRELGLRVVFQPSAVAFHDKRLSTQGGWQPSSSERFYSAEAALLLTYKWSREDLTEKILEDFLQHGDEFQKKAVVEFNERKERGLLPKQRDQSRAVAQFVDGNYAKHRYAI